MTRRNLDITLLIAVLLLLLFSVCFVYTASSAKADRDHNDSTFYLKRHSAKLAIGVILMVIALRVDYHTILRYAPPVYWMLLAVLLALLLVPESWVIRGSRRWLMLGPVQFQPSEMAKFSLIFYLAANLTKPKLDLRNFTDGLLPQIFLIGAVIVAILMEPDLGTSISIATVAFFLLFVSGVRLSHLFMLFGTGVISVIMMTWRVGYQRGRVEAFLNTLTGKAEAVWQIKQSLIGFGNGGFFGLGLGNSRQKLHFLPEPYTDFIMSIIGEELGMIGTLCIMILFFIILWRGYYIAQNASDQAGALAALGITWIIGFNAFINIAVATNVLPTTGIPLPFVSYGGSSLVMHLIAAGILLNISQHRPSGKSAGRGLTNIPLVNLSWYGDHRRRG